MNANYLRVTNIYSLRSVLDYLQKLTNPDDVVVFFDWDDTLVNPDHDKIIEPETTRELFDYMIKNKIFFSIITGRFHDSACDDSKRNILAMQKNIIETMYPSINNLGIDTSKYNTEQFKQNIHEITDENGACVGILYMGIFFSGTKGAAIKNYLRQMGMNKSEVIFIDDYEPYLYETTKSLPYVTAFRRLPNYVN